MESSEKNIGEINVGDELIVCPLPELTPKLIGSNMVSLRIRVLYKTPPKDVKGDAVIGIQRGMAPPVVEISESELKKIVIRRYAGKPR